MDERINYLLLKFEEGKLSKVETDELLELTDSKGPHIAEAIALMINAQVPVTLTEVDDWDALFGRVVAVDRQVPRRRLLSPSIRWLAAAVILITISAGAWFYFPSGHKNDIHTSQYANDVPPGGNDAILTLGDGSKISLTDASEGELLNTGGISIVKQADGQVVYTPISSDKAAAVTTYNTIVTPRGGQYQVNLPDGTRVWLNAASSLKFPTSFVNLKERKVEVSGEAYFEVAKNRQQPFKVISSVDDYGRAQETEVLGTHFNINAYDDEPETKTTLLEGSVSIAARQNVNKKYDDVILSPGQQSIVSNGQIRTVMADTEESVAWKNGSFVFANEKIESIMRKISRWYNVDVVYQGKITDNNFVGTVQRFKNVSEALHILELTKLYTLKLKEGGLQLCRKIYPTLL